MKRTLGIIFLVLGLILGIFGFTKQQDDNKILDIGNVELKKESDTNVNWMMMVGGASLVVGIVLLAVPSKTT